MHVRSPSAALLADVPVRFYVFDLLRLDDESTIALPYEQRRQLAIEDGMAGADAVVVLEQMYAALPSLHCRGQVRADRHERYRVAGKGMYVLAEDGTTQAAAKKMGRPSVKYVFVPKEPKLDAYIKANTSTPMSVLTKDVELAGTRTTHDDGSVDYQFTADKGVGAVLHVDRAGVLMSACGRSTTDYLALDYQYGQQKVPVPAARVPVDLATLIRAVAYLSMQDAVKTSTDKGADETRWAFRGRRSGSRRCVR